MALTTITGPVGEIFTAADMRELLSLRDDETDRDTLIESYIASARGWVEAHIKRRLLTQTVRLSLDGFGCGHADAVALPIAPIQSVDQVQYLDGTGIWQTMAAADYRLIASRSPCELRPAYGQTWPVPRLDVDVVRIDLIVGYGASAADVPAPIQQAIRVLVLAWFDPDAAGADPEAVRAAVAQMLSPFRLWV